MPNEILSLAESQIRRLEGELEGTAKRLQEVQEEQKRITENLNAWRVIARSNGALTPDMSVHSPVTITAEATSDAATEEPDTAGYGSKIAAVRNIFRENPERGFAPGELWREVQRLNIADNRNFVYGTLAKMRIRGEIAPRRGRYYATQQLLGIGGEQSSLLQ